MLRLASLIMSCCLSAAYFHLLLNIYSFMFVCHVPHELSHSEPKPCYQRALSGSRRTDCNPQMLMLFVVLSVILEQQEEFMFFHQPELSSKFEGPGEKWKPQNNTTKSGKWGGFVSSCWLWFWERLPVLYWRKTFGLFSTCINHMDFYYYSSLSYL